MRKLPSISGREARKAFERAGWKFVRQKGSHMILTKPGMEVTLSVPDHKSLKKPLLRKLINDANVKVEDFIGYL